MIIAPGATSRSITVYAYNVTTGLPYETAAYNDASIALWYRRGATGAKTAITPANLSALTDAWSSGGFKSVDENAVRLDLPDAAIAAGVTEVEVGGAATAWVLIPMTIQLETPQTGDSFASVGTIAADVTTLLSRLSAARAGYLDNLSAGAVALQSTLTTVAGYIDTEIAAIISTLSTLTTSVSGVAAAVWSYTTRTLTQGASSVVAAVTGTSVTVYRGTKWTIPLTGLTDFTGYTGLYFGVKGNPREDADTASVCLVKTTTGLIAFDGDDTITAGHAAIVVNSSTSITITVEADATQYATPGQYSYGVKALDASGKPYMVSSGGTFNIVADEVMAIS